MSSLFAYCEDVENNRFGLWETEYRIIHPHHPPGLEILTSCFQYTVTCFSVAGD